MTLDDRLTAMVQKRVRRLASDFEQIEDGEPRAYSTYEVPYELYRQTRDVVNARSAEEWARQMADDLMGWIKHRPGRERLVWRLRPEITFDQTVRWPRRMKLYARMHTMPPTGREHENMDRMEGVPDAAAIAR